MLHYKMSDRVVLVQQFIVTKVVVMFILILGLAYSVDDILLGLTFSVKIYITIKGKLLSS